MTWKKFVTWSKGFLNDLIKDIEDAVKNLGDFCMIEEIERSVVNLADFWIDFYHTVIHPQKRG